MINVKPVNIYLDFIVRFIQVYVLNNGEEKGYMFHVSYVTWKIDVCDGNVQIFHMQ